MELKSAMEEVVVEMEAASRVRVRRTALEREQVAVVVEREVVSKDEELIMELYRPQIAFVGKKMTTSAL